MTVAASTYCAVCGEYFAGTMTRHECKGARSAAFLVESIGGKVRRLTPADLDDIGIEIVDLIRGYTVEHSPDEEATRVEYARAGAHLRQRLGFLLAKTLTEKEPS